MAEHRAANPGPLGYAGAIAIALGVVGFDAAVVVWAFGGVRVFPRATVLACMACIMVGAALLSMRRK